jgi:hypothetical protein
MSSDDLASAVQLLPIWFFGAIVGLLLPRPKWMSGKTSIAMSFPLLSKTLLGIHAALILREIWKHCTHPGTFRGLARATVQWVSGNGWTFSWPAHAVASSKATETPVEPEAATPERMDAWYVGEKDLAFFKYHAVEGGPCQGASEWQQMMQKDIPGFVRYQSWRRTLPDGKTEYKSVTISPNATAREFSDLYLDDDFRRNWDGMVYHHEVLEHGDFNQRQQVVRWIRRFPFAFLSDREYTIARREFREDDGSIYACTKAVHDHPREYKNGGVVKMDVFHSMWRNRTVADPWGADTPACETILLHHEQFKISENLARFAVKHGMWGFVKKLASTVPVYVEARRKRVAPTEDDPQAYGAGEVPNPPALSSPVCHLSHSDSAMSLSTMGASSKAWGKCSSECGSDDSAQPRQGHAPSHQHSRRMKQVATVLVAGGIALAIKARAGSTGAGSGAGKQQRRHQRRQQVVSHRLAEVLEVEDE